MRRKATPAEINTAFEKRRAEIGKPMTFDQVQALDAELAREIERDDYLVDRERLDVPCTGILVRARIAGVWSPADIASLERGSLLRWLRSRGGSNLFAENCILRLLGHPPAYAANEDVEIPTAPSDPQTDYDWMMVTSSNLRARGQREEGSANTRDDLALYSYCAGLLAGQASLIADLKKRVGEVAE